MNGPDTTPCSRSAGGVRYGKYMAYTHIYIYIHIILIQREHDDTTS